MNDTRDERLGWRGFDPTQPTEEFFGCFTKAEAQASLFGSTRFEHKLVRLTDKDGGVDMPVVLDLARPLFVDEEIGKMSSEANWYFEGWVFEPGRSGVRRVRIHVSTMDYDSEFGKEDIFTWQWIEPTMEQLPLDASILKLELKGRTNTLLWARDLRTIQDVIEYARRHDLSEIQGFGPRLQADLGSKMEAAGHKLP